MPKTQIVIDVEQGIVSVYAAEPDDFDVTLVDWDSEGLDPCSPNMVEVPCRGGLHSAFVMSGPVQPLSDLAGSETERAIELAEAQGALPESEAVLC